jgi:hypothetical protein
MERPAHEYRRKGGMSKINVMRVAHQYIWNLICGLMQPCRIRSEAPDLVIKQELGSNLNLERKLTKSE